MNTKLIFVSLALAIGLFAACSNGDDDTTPNNSTDTQNTDNGNSNASNNSTDTQGNNTSTEDGKTTEWKDGYITYYGQPDSYDKYPYPLPEMEKGYYNVAVGVHFFPNYILGSAYEIKYGDNTIRVIGKDICPDGDNSWFDNTPEGFEYLTGNKALGKVNVKWRETPYYTNKNIVLQVKSGSNNWFLGAYIFNGRYGVAKVELSKDGKKFYEMKPYTYNMFWELQCPFDQYNCNITIRVTDRYGHVVTSKPTNINPNSTDSYDLGANFEY